MQDSMIIDLCLVCAWEFLGESYIYTTTTYNVMLFENGVISNGALIL